MLLNYLCISCHYQTLQTVASFLLLFVGLHLLQSLRHHRPFAVFNNIYGHAAVDIVVFAVSIYACFYSSRVLIVAFMHVWHFGLVVTLQSQSLKIVSVGRSQNWDR